MDLNEMNLNQYQDLAMVTAAPLIGTDGLRQHALHGMASEVGEIHAMYQKTFQGHEIEMEHLEKELGDLLWFVAEFARAMGWNLNDVAALNISKLQKRYPHGFEEYFSLHRAKGDV